MATLVLFFTAMAVLTAGHWCNPEVDVGRETMAPLRLLGGERLWTDMQWLFGPLPVYLNSCLFKWFGTSLTAGYAHGLAVAWLFGLLIYAICRHWLTATQSAWVTAFFWTTAAFTTNNPFNWIFPYSFNVIDAMVLVAAAVFAVLKATDSTRPLWPLVAGGCAALALLTKIDVGTPCVVVVVLWMVLPQRQPPMSRWRRIAWTALGASVVTVTMMVWFGLQFPTQNWARIFWPADSAHWSDLWGMTWTFHVMGLDRPWVVTKSLLAAVLAPSVFLCGLGLFCWRFPLNVAAGAFIVLAVSVSAWWTQLPFYEVVFQGSLFFGGAAPVLGALLLVEWVRAVRSGWSVCRVRSVVLLTIALGLLWRVLAASAWGNYPNFFAAFAWPVIAILCLRYLPDWIGARSGRIRIARRAAMSALIALTALAFRYTIDAMGQETGCVASERGRIFVSPERAALFKESVEFIREHSAPRDTLTVLPRCTLLPFLAARPVATPWFDLTFAVAPSPAMDECLRQSLASARPRFIVIFDAACNHITHTSLFGRDCFPQTYRWIQEHYRLAKRAGQKRDFPDETAHSVDIFERLDGQAPPVGISE